MSVFPMGVPGLRDTFFENGGVELSLEELLDEWIINNPPCEDTLALQASIRDMANGKTGRGFDDFARDFRERNGLSDPARAYASDDLKPSTPA
jgi:hypothetical protein